MQSPRRLVLVVDADPGFAEDARMLFAEQRILTARTLEEAGDIVPGGRVDVVVLGPSFGSEEGVMAASALRAADPGLPLTLVANLVTNRMLLAGMKTGMASVVETPLTLRKVDEILAVARGGLPPAASAPAGTDPVPDRHPGLDVEPVSGPAAVVSFVPHAAAAATVAPAPAPVAPAPPAPAPTSRWLPPAVAEPSLPVPQIATPPAPPVRPLVTDRELFAPDPEWEASAPARTRQPEPVTQVAAETPAVQALPVAPPAALIETPAPAPVGTGPIEILDHPRPVPVVGPIEILPPLMPPPGAPVAAPLPSDPMPLPPLLPPPLATPGAPLPGPIVAERPATPVMPSPPPASPPSGAWGRDEVVVIHPESPPPLRAGVPSSPFDPGAPVAGDRPTLGTGRVVAVMAGKGGSGKTVTATNLAMALTFHRGEDRVVIVDTDLQFGDVALLLQLDPSRTLLDVARHIDDLSDAKLESMLLRHESGLRVLPAPVLPVSEDEIPAKVIAAIIDRLKTMHEVVVVDTPPIFDDHLITVLEQADDVLVVVDMDLPSVKNAKIALDALRGSGFPMNRLQLVVNRVNAKARLDLVELERSLGLRVAGSIPSDRLIPQSVNEGIPVVALSPRSRVAKAFHILAGLIRDSDAPR